MVRLSAHRRIGTVAMVFGLATGAVAIALGIGLVLEAESAFGKAWASMFIVFGLVAALGAFVASRPLDGSSARGRVVGTATLLLLGGWAAVVALVGALEASWLWAVIMGVPAAYLLWAAARTARRAS